MAIIICTFIGIVVGIFIYIVIDIVIGIGTVQRKPQAAKVVETLSTLATAGWSLFWKTKCVSDQYDFVSSTFFSS